jgi:hypothetical protein
LGKPGGPCHVVRRIEEEVGSPAVKDHLVTKVEEGEHLSNPETAAVYELESEKTRGFVTRLYVGPHTQYRMDLRRVTIRDLKDAVEELGKLYHVARKSGDARNLRPFEAFQEGRKLEHVTRSGLQVVLAPFKGGAQVVTTFWKGQPDPPPPGQCDPVALRVAARYARRTIRFDTRAVSVLGAALAEKAVDKLIKTLPPDSAIEWELDRHATIVEDALELPDVRGRAKPIAVRVKHRRMTNARPTAGGTFAPGAGEIALYLNSSWTPAALQTELLAVQGAFSTFLVHEVTHALDVLPEGEYEGADGDSAKYFNQPAEFRAYAKQIVTDILGRWKMVLRRNPGKSGAPLVEAALESSPNYAKVRDYFDRRNHQRLRQTVVRELQDAGLMPA